MASVDETPQGLRVQLDAQEAGVLRNLTAEMRSLLKEPSKPSDPVMNRLFPAAYESPDDEAAYRGMVRDDLHGHKLATVDAMARTLGRRGGVEVSLSTEEAEIWLTYLVDLRLAIGTRMNVTEEKMEAEIDPRDPEAPSLAVLHWLGYLQETILRHLTH